MMKISIDTAQDSKEEIRKAIRLLQALVEHEASQGSRNIFDSPSDSLFGDTPSAPSPESSSTNAFSDLFSDNAPAPQTTTTEETEEKKEESSQVELY